MRSRRYSTTALIWTGVVPPGNSSHMVTSVLVGSFKSSSAARPSSLRLVQRASCRSRVAEISNEKLKFVLNRGARNPNSRTRAVPVPSLFIKLVAAESNSVQHSEFQTKIRLDFRQDNPRSVQLTHF